MIENGKLTYANLETLCKMAHEFECEIQIYIYQSHVEINVSREYATEIESNTKTTQKIPPRSVIVSAKTDDEFRKLQEDLRKEGWAI